MRRLCAAGLVFRIENFFCLGSPLPVFLSLRWRDPTNPDYHDHILPRDLVKADTPDIQLQFCTTMSCLSFVKFTFLICQQTEQRPVGNLMQRTKYSDYSFIIFIQL